MSEETVIPKKEIRPLRVSIKTFGCQMNEYDSALAAGLLRKEGHEVVEDDARADVILFNTCSVRDHAEERVFQQLGALKHRKRANADFLIGVMGCMVENYKTKFFSDYPHIDFLIGTRSIRELPETIAKVRAEKRQIMELEKAGFGYELYEYSTVENQIHAHLPIMTGCDKVCTFCVVPYVRGREISRSQKEVVNEVKRLVQSGVKHVTLLGQNVNSYASHLDDGSNFSSLLREVARVPGIEKVSFTTSHPQDAYEELFQTIKDEPKISRRFHLPLQSGSDAVLKSMRRDHTLLEYRAKIDRMRELIPDISITTDIICGFPGEGLAEYEETRRALMDIEFDGAFIFQYSPRPHTTAGRWEDSVPDAEKNRRVNELLNYQREITRTRNFRFVGRTFPVMIDAISKKNEKEVIARTWHEKKVVFPGSIEEKGHIVQVRLKELYAETYLAERLEQAV